MERLHESRPSGHMLYEVMAVTEHCSINTVMDYFLVGALHNGRVT
ncbi:hypothetical protein ALP72_01979 [Pseudomonas coronafaciens pv. coronafaciens]|nr:MULTISPECIES: hypothetical protein [Pseudomonas syringae group]RMN31011.1 hypothetical protein ALQ61_03633 [Pseudomonas coronafaciens pv. zizaniae]RMP32976.1 hypothetical protein ALQ25_01588 [Pseudomonas coronafaciens pv. atropurpurea]RMS09366.1 hypothetical protein ALP72_01979 [Pseudomonas coronafaciens pv. coronafaciens]